MTFRKNAQRKSEKHAPEKPLILVACESAKCIIISNLSPCKLSSFFVVFGGGLTRTRGHIISRNVILLGPVREKIATPYHRCH